MTLVLDTLAPAHPRNLWRELHTRQPALAVFSAAMLPLFLLAVLGTQLDPRTFEDTPVWVKPAKFLLSFAVFTATLGWMFGYMDQAARRSRLARWSVWVLIAGAVFELAYISLQASRAEASHFNSGEPVAALMYALMGLAALALTGTVLSFAWLIARRPAPGLDPAFRLSVLLGLVLTFVLGAGFGGYMGSQTGHFVGTSTGALPLLGWSTTAGDLRPAHFFGIHAQQALPLFGALAAAAFSGRTARLAVWAGAGLYTAFSVAVFLQALAGRPFLAL